MKMLSAALAHRRGNNCVAHLGPIGRKRIALEEEVADGKSVNECEYVFYARIVNLDDLLKADAKEHQEQWEIKVPKTDGNASKGRFRIRKTVKDGSDPEYVFTTKIPVPGTNDSIETPVPTTQAQFESFRLMCSDGMLKDRYSFKVEGSDLVWEVDVFLKPEGGYYEWCKIDLEVEEMGEQVPPFPIELANIITNQNGQRTPEEETRVRALYETDFRLRNPQANSA